MANNNNRTHINVGELDFETIKEQLKQYYKENNEFSDYDFDGSGLQIFLNVLAHNTFLNSFMGNMIANEMFLDSAQTRHSVVSHAKTIGYTPRSVNASMASIDISIPEVGGAPAYLTMDAGTMFDSESGYTFSTKEPYILYPTGVATTYEVQDVEIYDGAYVEYEYTVDLTNPNQKYMVPAVGADTQTLTVSVKENSGASDKDPYFLNDNITEITDESLVYFLTESGNGLFEVSFGDGYLGKALVDGNVVILSYIIANGKEEANGIDEFLSYQSIATYSAYDISTNFVSYNGAERESIDDIRYRSVNHFEAQNRAVAVSDYETIILQNYPFIESLNTWGGEDNDPPIYGKVFFGIKPKHTSFLSDTLKEKIKSELVEKYNVVTVSPEIVDPDYLYVMLDVSCFYNVTKTTLTPNEIMANVNLTIHTYFTETTQRYKTPFYYSPLVNLIDETDSSIVSSLTDIKIQKRFKPFEGIEQTYIVKFFNELKVGTVESTYYDHMNADGVVTKAALLDDSKGIIYAWNVEREEKIADVGTVDYLSGELTFTINPYSTPADTRDIRIIVVPAINNIDSGHNQIITPDDTASNIDYNRPQGIYIAVVNADKAPNITTDSE